VTDIVKCYKLARPDGFDFYTGNTINYRGDGQFPHIVKAPQGAALPYRTCKPGILHASVKPNDCFVGAHIPCSAYLVQGEPVCGNAEKYGFLELEVLEEISDMESLLGWRYSEAIDPVHPFKIWKRKPTKADIESLRQWASVRASVGASVRASVRASVWASVRDSVWDSVWASVRDSVGDSVRDSVGDSVRDSVWDSVGDSVGAYIGYIFIPSVKKWYYCDNINKAYPFQDSVDLWKRGLAPSFDGKVWRLHSGKKADIVWEGTL
jgi:hypothetical protein